SFCCFTGDNEPPLALRYAIERLDPTTVVIAAAGNHGMLPRANQPGLPGPPATTRPPTRDRVIPARSHDMRGQISAFSPVVPWVRLTALGEDVISTFLDRTVRMIYREGDTGPATIDFADGVAKWSGTSFSSALVAGWIAAATKDGSWAAQLAM